MVRVGESMDKCSTCTSSLLVCEHSCLLPATMSLLALGPIMFGTTTAIIAYFRRKASTAQCNWRKCFFFGAATTDMCTYIHGSDGVCWWCRTCQLLSPYALTVSLLSPSSLSSSGSLSQCGGQSSTHSVQQQLRQR